MKTIVHVLAVLSVVAAATPTRAHTADYALPRHARDFQAVHPRLLPPPSEPRTLSSTFEDESHDTLTGGPVGGLIDKN